jgi:beta-glucanase (GH16 family)
VPGVKKNFKGQPGTGTRFVSHRVNGVTVLGGPSAGQLLVSAIRAENVTPELPDWLGQRPPVDGEWTKTFEDNFDGSSVDLTKWNIYGPNFWDKRTHFSKDNAIVKDGTLTLRVERKTGRHNDSPDGKETDYATGFADTYGKWVQRYGYFEARVKLPTAPCLWPAFWLMPDRGLEAGEQWKRQSTQGGGMEFDIIEQLSIWGPQRLNMAMHWDGYGSGHKATGSGSIYVPADKDGFIVVGLLWTPESAVLYGNGKELARWKNPRISDVPSCLILDHVTGGWETEPLDDAQLPADFVIDYVRVWQRADLASAVDGPKPNQGTPAAPKE